MSYVLDWIQEACRLLKEAQLDAYVARQHSPEWHAAVERLLKPTTPRSG